VFLVEATTNLDPHWANVCGARVVATLQSLGETLLATPDFEQPRVDGPPGEITVVLASTLHPDDIRAALTIISGVATATVSAWPPATPGTSPRSRGVGDGAGGAGLRVAMADMDLLGTHLAQLAAGVAKLSTMSWRLNARRPNDPGVSALGDVAAEIAGALAELEAGIERIRAVTAGRLYGGFERVVAETARDQGKQVELLIEGEDATIDRGIGEALREPIRALIVNAIEHGIEPPGARLAAGRRNPALVRLSVIPSPGELLVSVEDDGEGVDLASVRASAVRAGIVARDDVVQLSDDEATHLVFAPGVSAAEVEPDEPARGYGLDSVRAAVEQLGGRLEIESRVGAGTRISMRIPVAVPRRLAPPKAAKARRSA
jgi:two-component system chemotaxis sensor kinase CheA